MRGKRGRLDRSQRGAVARDDLPLERGLARRAIGWNSQRRQGGGVLVGTPLGTRKYEAGVSEDGGDGHGEDRRQRIPRAGGPAGIGDGGKGGGQTGRRDSLGRDGGGTCMGVDR